MIKRLLPLFSLPILLALAFMLAGCANATPTPDPDGAILTGFNALPKSLATVLLTETLNAPQAQATIDTHRPTETLPPPTYTPTPTPYVGIFMGAPTFSAGTFIGPTAIGNTGNSVVIVTMAPAPGTKVASSGNNVPASSGGHNCAVPAAGPFTNAAHNATVQSRLGCPSGTATTLKLVAQPFQTGTMFWRDTKEIYVLSSAGLQKGSQTDTFWRFNDTWNDGMPANDPAQVPPAGLLQPVRGFGFIWRSNSSIRNSLGWALSPETQFDATWQQFERGWMMTNTNGAVLALVPSGGPPVTTGIYLAP